MNNPRIDELLKGCGKDFRLEYISFNCGTSVDVNKLMNNQYVIRLCPTCKAELLGILGQMKCEVKFTINFINIDDNNPDKRNQENRIKELNSDIKRIEEMLK